MDERVEPGLGAADAIHDYGHAQFLRPPFHERERSLHRRHVALQAHHEVLVAARLDSEQADSRLLDDLVRDHRRDAQEGHLGKAQGQVQRVHGLPGVTGARSCFMTSCTIPSTSIPLTARESAGAAACGRQACAASSYPQSARMHAILERMSSRPSCSFGESNCRLEPSEKPRSVMPARKPSGKFTPESMASIRSSSLNWMRFASSQWPARNSLYSFTITSGTTPLKAMVPPSAPMSSEGNRISSHPIRQAKSGRWGLMAFSVDRNRGKSRLLSFTPTMRGQSSASRVSTGTLISLEYWGML